VSIKEAFSKLILDNDRVQLNGSTLKAPDVYASIFWSSSKKTNNSNFCKNKRITHI
jgi:hypothetical protein